MYIAAAALYVLGVFLKAVPKIPNWVIPFVLTAAGVVFGMLLTGGADGVLQGVLAAGLAVLVNQGYKQVREQIVKTE
ncbi:MAG: holin [Clostridiales bacterium]|nr:holin [Clostridiales bacterium]